MATAIWQDDNGIFDDTANWSGGSGAGGVPANGDTVVFGTGTQGLTTNLTTGLTGITLRAGPQYSGDVGSATARLDLDGNNFDWGASGRWWVTGVLTNIDVSGSGKLTLYGNASTDVTNLRVISLNGTVIIEDGATVDDIIVAGQGRPTVTVESGVLSIDDVTIDAGRVTINSAIAGTCLVRAGSLTIGGSGSVASLIVKGGAAVSYRSSGTITTLEVWDKGSFSLRESEASSVTVTNCTMYGGSCDLRSSAADVTITNGITYYDGVVYPPLGSSVTV